MRQILVEEGKKGPGFEDPGPYGISCALARYRVSTSLLQRSVHSGRT